MAIKVCEKKVENGAVTFKFAHGPEYTVKPDQFSAEIVTDLTLHGLSQKLGDAYADSKGNPRVAEEYFLEVLEQLGNGEWAAKRGEGAPRVSDLAQAYARVKSVDMEAAIAKVKSWDNAMKAKVRKIPEIAQALITIQQERLAAAPAVDIGVNDI